MRFSLSLLVASIGVLSFSSCSKESDTSPIQKKPEEVLPVHIRHFIVSGSGVLRTPGDQPDRFYMVIHDSDTSLDYLIVQDAGITELKPKPVTGVEK